MKTKQDDSTREFDVARQEYLKYAKILEELVDDVAAEVISKFHKEEAEIVINGEIEG